MERQHLKLMDMIAAIVSTLDKSEMFQSIIGHSGRLHARFSNTARISRLIVIGERPRGGRKPRSRSIQLGCGSLSLGSHSAPGLERFRERVVRVRRQIGVERQ
jgi:hypothetical protein